MRGGFGRRRKRQRNEMGRACWSARIRIVLLLWRMCGGGGLGRVGFALVMGRGGLGGGRRLSEGSGHRWRLRIVAGMEKIAVGV